MLQAMANERNGNGWKSQKSTLHRRSNRTGINDIVTQIRTRGTVQPLTTSDLIALKQQSVSDRVINALQHQPRPATVVRQPRPVVVESYRYHHHYPSPVWHHWHDYHHHPRHGIHFSFGH